MRRICFFGRSDHDGVWNCWIRTYRYGVLVFFSWFVSMFLVCRILLSYEWKFWCLFGETGIVSFLKAVQIFPFFGRGSFRRCRSTFLHRGKLGLFVVMCACCTYFISRIFADSWIATMLVHRWIVWSNKGTDIDISVDLFVFCMYVSFSFFFFGNSPIRWLKNLTRTRID